MYQLWIQWTLHLHDTPEILIPAVMDGLAVIALLAFIRRFREMRGPLLAMYVLVLLHAFILPYSFTLGMGGLLIVFPFFTLWGPAFFICFLLCQANADKIEDNEKNRELLRIGTALFAFYLLLHIIFILGGC
jgi:peptidoglycan/LPS O-acetylase OafA/YrhL